MGMSADLPAGLCSEFPAVYKHWRLLYYYVTVYYFMVCNKVYSIYLSLVNKRQWIFKYSDLLWSL